MVDHSSPLSSVRGFMAWEPVLRLMLAGNPEGHAARSVRVAGRISRHGWSLAHRGRMSPSGRLAVERIQRALASSRFEEVAFTAEVRPTGRTTLDLAWPNPAVEPAVGHPDLGVLVLVEGSLPEPWRRTPDPAPGATPAPSVDLELLERTLRERLPDAVDATDEEIAATEARLGITLPDELKVLYRVTRARWEDWGDDPEAPKREAQAVGYELFALEDLYSVDAGSRHSRWESGAMRAVVTQPDAAVQGLAGSPGWIAFGSNGGDEAAVDLTPGPRGHTGQIILIDHEQSIGAELVADSLTDLVLGRVKKERRDLPGDGLPVVAEVGSDGVKNVRAAAHPALEVLSIGMCEGAPFSLAPVIGLPRLRTLVAGPGTLSDPPEVAELTGLEFLELGPQEWRVLLDAGAVPRTLSAAAIGKAHADPGKAHADPDELPVVAIANELLALWGRPQIIQSTIEGDLGPVA